MSETEELPELSAEAKAFLAGHEKTGEPAADALERARLRLGGTANEVPAAPLKVLQSRTRRTLFPPEVMAAAAVVTLLLGAQALYLVLRSPIAPAAEPVAEVKTPEASAAEVKKALGAAPRDEGADLAAVAAAWRRGDYEGARRLASQDCRSAGCAQLDSELAKMVGLAQSVGTISHEELSQLAAFDETLAGSDSVLRLQLEARKVPPVTPAASLKAERLFEEGKLEKTRRNFDAAALRFEECIEIDPGYHPCYRMLGTVYASIATRDSSAIAMDKARGAYQDYLKVAPPDDEYSSKVKAILDSAKEGGRDDGVPAEIPLSLSVDGTVKLPLGHDVSRLAVGDFNVIDAKVLDSQTVQIEGIRSGRTTVQVWFVDGSRTTLKVQVKVADRRIKRVTALFADATRAMTANDFVRAGAFAKQLLELEPGHAGAKNILAQLHGQAQQAYFRGYQLSESDPAGAITSFQLVVLLTQPEDELHQKAQSRLRDLRK